MYTRLAEIALLLNTKFFIWRLAQILKFDDLTLERLAELQERSHQSLYH